MLETLWQDLRYSARSLRRSPAFTIAAVLTLAIGIGANTAMFALVDAVLLRALPVPAPKQLFVVRESDPSGGVSAAETRRMQRFSYQRFIDMTQALPSDVRLAAMTRVTRLSVRTNDGATPAIVSGQLVSGSFFDTFGVHAFAGRLLGDADNRLVDGHPVAVVSDRYWRRQLGAAPDVVGRRISINNQPFTIVGVAAAPFEGPYADDRTEVWVPLAMQHALRYRGNVSTYGEVDPQQPWMAEDKIAWLQIVARIPRSPDRIQQTLAVANRSGLERYASTFGENARQRLLRHTIALDPVPGGFAASRDQYSGALLILMGIVAIVLLVATVNITNLLLARATARRREVAVRLAVGASRARLVRQCLTESVLLAGVGGAAGLLIGQYASHAAAGWISNVTPDLVPTMLTPDVRVLAFTAAVSILAALLFGLLPALRATDAHPIVNTVRTSGSAATAKGMGPLVSVQLAMSVVVVVAAVLLGRTLFNLVRVNPGFERERLITVGIDPLISGYRNADTPAMYDRVVAAVQQLPGVSSAAVAMNGILTGDQSVSDFMFEGYQSAPGEDRDVQVNLVGPGYFRSTGIAVARGREFDPRDTRRMVAIVNESLARRFFSGVDAVGKRLGESELDTEIIGVVHDAAVRGVREPVMPTVYLPLVEEAFGRSVNVRVSGDPDPLVPAVREAIRRVEPGLVITGVRTIREALDGSIARETRVAYLTFGFAGIALLLACLGLYGVLSYAVVRRTQEIGVRVAIGARPRDVLRLILGNASRVIAGGLVAGLIGAFASRALLAGLLFGVTPADPWTYAMVAVALAAVAFTASLLPARRAARVDPVIALRTE
jgi:predicted permease